MLKWNLTTKIGNRQSIGLMLRFGNEHVEIQELYGVKHVTQGNVVSHPYWHIDVEEIN